MDVTSLQSGIHGMVAQNCSVYWDNLDRNYGGYRKALQEQADAEEAKRRMHEARTSKTAVLLSAAYESKQKSIRDNHERRRKAGVKKVEWGNSY